MSLLLFACRFYDTLFTAEPDADGRSDVAAAVRATHRWLGGLTKREALVEPRELHERCGDERIKERLAKAMVLLASIDNPYARPFESAAFVILGSGYVVVPAIQGAPR